MKELGSNKRIFQPIDDETWQKEAIKTLKGAPFETLYTTTYENIKIKPLYTKSDIENPHSLDHMPGESPFVRGTNLLGYTAKPWLVAQKLDQKNLSIFNQSLKDDLTNGQTMIHFEVTDSANPASGLPIYSNEDLLTVFEGINLEKTPLFINTGANSLPFFTLLFDYCKEKKALLHDLKGTVGMDPLSDLVRNGSLHYQVSALYDSMAFITKWAEKMTPNLSTILVNSEPYHNGGANAVSELAYSLATAVDYLYACIERGLDIDEVAPRMIFSFSIGSDFFIEIAKLRAAKRVWATIVDAFDGNMTSQKMRIHVQTSAYTKTHYDPYVNMIRSTIEAFAGAIGGIDSMHVTAYDEQIQSSKRIDSRRMARNIQLILQEEAFLTNVIDPAGGSWYIESLTNELAEKAYALFQEIESYGGMLEALKKGTPQNDIETTAMKRRENVQKRKDKIVGVNMYADLAEKPVVVRQTERIKPDQIKRIIGLEDRMKKMIVEANLTSYSSEALLKSTIIEVQPLEVQAIKQHRLAEEFETLRTSSDAFLLKHGTRPKIGFIHLGTIAATKARADFATGFFEAGGFELIHSAGLYTGKDVSEWIHEHPLSAYVLCGKDDMYRAIVIDLTHKLEKTKITYYLVGDLSLEDEEMYRSAGVKSFIHSQTNCYETLLSLQLEMGVARDEAN
ncbi:methylmalonyl-CoA mutase family protein [Bacillus sp. PS06]|uniref:methylmalonyl-CoA mutase family protein n=1 Tax=Bacillus sp. PS06 TaxID=2764176 RepID=UPI001CD8F77F|nr:methylmalonyl-CoA mutase family protein [Bacillus sp. PS06]